MGVEVDCYVFKRAREDTLVNELAVGKGSSEILSGFLKPAEMLVICDITGANGVVYFKKPDRLTVRIYKDMDDQNGRPVNPQKPIRISGEESLSIASRRKKRGVDIYLDSDGEEENFGVPEDRVLV